MHFVVRNTRVHFNCHCSYPILLETCFRIILGNYEGIQVVLLLERILAAFRKGPALRLLSALLSCECRQGRAHYSYSEMRAMGHQSNQQIQSLLILMKVRFLLKSYKAYAHRWSVVFANKD